MKSKAKMRAASVGLAVLLLVVGLTGAAAAVDFRDGRKLDLTVLPSGDRTARIALADARQVGGDVKVRVRVVRQGLQGLHRAHTIRLAVVNAQGEVEHSDTRRLSRTALQRRGAGYQWLTLSVPHEMTAGDTVVLSLGPAPGT